MLCIGRVTSQSYWSPSLQQNAKPEAVFYNLNRTSLQRQGQSSFNAPMDTQLKEVTLPNEMGELEVFDLIPAPVMAPEMAQKHPLIQTYKGVSQARSGVSARISVVPKGISAWIRNTKGNDFFVQPEKDGLHFTYQRQKNDRTESFNCKVESSDWFQKNTPIANQAKRESSISGTLKTFRIAIVGTGEYTAHWGDDDNTNGTNQEDAYAAVIATLNRVNEVFETDLGVHLQLVTGSDMMQPDSATDSFTGNYNQEIQAFLTDQVGESNYDVGHLFGYSPDADGNSGCIGCICVDHQKGQGYTLHPFVSLNGPYQNDYFDLDFVAHELGHQFGAYHTFSHVEERYGFNMEPGSGTTIMGYAGVTGVDDVQPHGDPYFHYISIQNIRSVVEATSCASELMLSNTTPQINPNPNYTIPKETAYALVASATDAEQETLYYTWEQLDSGNITAAVFGPQNGQGAQARSLPPSMNPKRNIPRWDRILVGQLTETNPSAGGYWETVSSVGRRLRWGLTVRDQFASASGQEATLAQDEMEITVTEAAGPFRIFSQADFTQWSSGQAVKIIWDVAQTRQSPVNTQTVTIDLSLEGDDVFTHTLLEQTPNDGEEIIIVPSGIDASQARIRVAPVDNIYFAINSSPIEIVSQPHSLTLSTYQVQLCQPNSIEINYTLSYPDGVTQLSLISLPAGVTGTFSNPTISSTSGSGVLTLTSADVESFGEYNPEIQAQSGDIISLFSFYFEVFTDELLPPRAIQPLDEAMSISPGTALTWEADQSASSYLVEWSTDSSFTQDVNQIQSNEPSISNLNFSADTTYYWRIKSQNDCGESAFSPVLSFTTTPIQCLTYSSENLPKPLQDALGFVNGITTAEVFIGNTNTINDLNVWVNLSHTFLKDLTLQLIAPDETVVDLVSETGGEFNNFTNTLFDTEASVPISSGSPPFSGTFRPIGDLSILNGSSISGLWTLKITDNYQEDTGSLLGFELRVCLEGIVEANSDEDLIVDRMDNCPEVTNPNQSDFDADGVGDLCDLDGVNNFQITKFNTTCVGKNNGRIRIEALAEFPYLLNLLGPGGLQQEWTFNNDGLLLSDLSHGDYSLCITSPSDSDFELCYTASIGEPEPFSVTSKILAKTQQVQLSVVGTESYQVILNDRLYLVQNRKQQRFPLEKGVNELEVIGEDGCEALYRKRLYLADKAMVYPNPANVKAIILAGGDYTRVQVQVYPINGEIVYEELHRLDATTRSIELDVSSYSAGMYVIRLFYHGGEEILKLIVE